MINKLCDLLVNLRWQRHEIINKTVNDKKGRQEEMFQEITLRRVRIEFYRLFEEKWVLVLTEGQQ